MHILTYVLTLQWLADRNYKPLVSFHKSFFKTQLEHVIQYSECFLKGGGGSNFYSFVTTILLILMFSYS